MAALLAHPRSAFNDSLRPRIRIDIRLHAQDGQSVPTFTTLDSIRGDAVITADVDTRFDQVMISFTGESLLASN